MSEKPYFNVGKILPKDFHGFVESLDGARFIDAGSFGMLGFIWFPDIQQAEADIVQAGEIQLIYTSNPIDGVKLPILVINSGAGVHEFPIYPTDKFLADSGCFKIILIDSVELEVKAVRQLELSQEIKGAMAVDRTALRTVNFDTYVEKHTQLMEKFPSTKSLLEGSSPIIQAYDSF